MGRIITVLCFFMLMAYSGQAGAAPNGLTASKTTIDGEIRNYWTYIPSGMDQSKPAPLLFVLHGSAGSGEDMMAVTQRGFEQLADKEKFVVIYPDALERRWNEQGGTVNDAGFLLTIVDQLAAAHIIDRRQVYVVGISNGGMMAQRMACEYSDRVAGIATIAGSLPEKLASTCKPSNAVSVMIIHGTEDPIVPWNGGAVAGFEEFGKVLSVRATVEFWSKNSRCSGKTVVVQQPDLDRQDGTQVRQEAFLHCSDKKEVLLVEVQGGGHTWPGGYQYLPERFIGKTSRDIDASRLIWDFFRRTPY